MLIIAAPFLALMVLEIRASGFDTLDDWLLQLQTLCAQGYSSSIHHEILSAMVCGQNPTTQQIMTDWSNVGLIPILIGAGTHFIFLEQFLNRLLRRHPALLKTSLLLFVCVTGFSPALTRSLIGQVFQDWNQKFKLGLGYPKIWLLSVLTCLMICPQWLSSIGFILGAQCASLMYLSFCLVKPASVNRPARKGDQWKFHLRFAVVRTVVFFVGVTPMLKILGLPVPQPASMFIQFFAIPIAGLLLFPVGVLERLGAFLIHPLDPFWNRVESLLHELSKRLPTFHPAATDLSPGSPHLFLCWSYLGSFFFLITLAEITRRSRVRFFVIPPAKEPRRPSSI